MSLRKIATGFAYFWAYMLAFLAVVGTIGAFVIIVQENQRGAERERKWREERMRKQPSSSLPRETP